MAFSSFKKSSIVQGLSKSTAISPSDISAELLIVAGGGGGGGGTYHGGGGGAGGLLHNYGGTPVTLNAGIKYIVTVGAGGTGGDGDTSTEKPMAGFQGGNSCFAGYTAFGGGGGGGSHYGYYGKNMPSDGGSGGGSEGISQGGTTDPVLKQAISIQTSQGNLTGYGNSGGKCTGCVAASGTRTDGSSGGGAGGAGTGAAGNTTSTAQNGGVGLSIAITGSATYYAGGGGGSTYGSTSTGAGGNGGGGAGGSNTTNPVAGSANTGGGGGGAERNGTANGAAGGSGVVIIRTLSGAITTGSPTITQDGAFFVYKFTGDGSIIF